MKPQNGLLPGFSDPVADSQETFRTVMNAMAHPGRIYRLPVQPVVPPPLFPTTGAICLTLLDMDTPLWLDPSGSSNEVLTYLRFHCGCLVSPDTGEAAFAIVGDGRFVPALSSFSCGDPLYPERSTTLIVQVGSLDNSRGIRLKGPGIRTDARLHAEGLTADFWPAFQAINKESPLGVDVLLVSPASLCGLPRTVEMEPIDLP